jgi:hypothetical protein
MALPKSIHVTPRVNLDDLDLLDFIDAALAVVPRHDHGAVELRVRDHKHITVVVLAPRQARAAAALLIAAAASIEDDEGQP